MNIDLTNIDEVVAKLEEADDAYFNTDKELMTDAEYDILKRTAHKLSPKHPYFIKVGADTRGGKLKLPYPMNGLDQIFENEIQPLWVHKHGLNDSLIVITDKLDGVSCMLVFADKDGDGHAEFQIAYSRGNSVEGADISRHVKKLKFPKIIHDCTLFVVRAEIIMKDKTFRDKYANDYSSARALVAGSMNRTTTEDKILDDIDLIAYTVVDQSNKRIDKHGSLAVLQAHGFKVPFTQIVKGSQLNDHFLVNCIEQSKATSPHELDGVVLSENHSGQSIKYKTLDKNSITTSAFKDLPIEISKWGLFKPRVEINPVKLFDTVVTFATAFNMKYVYDNKLGPGSTITLTKSGSVIPYILGSTPSTVPNYDNWFNQQMTRIAGNSDWEWNENEVEVVLADPDNHPTVRFKQVLDFFESIEVDLLKESTMSTLLTHYNWWRNPWSYEKTIDTVIDLSEQEWVKIIGSNGSKIYNSLHRRLGAMKLETLCGSLNYCGFGFGIRRAKILISQIDVRDIWHLDYFTIASLNGFDDKTAKKIAQGLPKIKDFLDRNKDYITIVEEKKTDELKDVSVVFTGFRDSDLEQKVEKMGGKVSSGVSKKTTYVVAADPGSTSGKAAKAKDLGVKVLSIDEFKDMFNL
jgi:DNA ligase (NAD+)